MVKLQKTKSGAFVISIPREKVQRANLQGGEEFDVDVINNSKDLLFVRLRKE